MKPNGEKCNREWLLYSPLKKMVYCFYCLLFSKSDVMCDGYNDWKNTNKINIELEKQIIETRDYWKNVLKRLIETIIFQ